MDPEGAKKALRLATRVARDLAEFAEPPAPPALKAISHVSELKPIDVFDRMILDAELRSTARKLFADGHYAQSVEEAFKYVNNLVKQRSGLSADGSDLMNRALSPGKPVLKLSDLKTVSQRDQQLGYMQMAAGAMTGIRNPRAHEHRYLDEPQVALELLSFANHLARLIGAATRARARKQP